MHSTRRCFGQEFGTEESVLFKAVLSKRNIMRGTYAILSFLVTTFKSQKKHVKCILIIHFIEPNISNILSFEHVIDIRDYWQVVYTAFSRGLGNPHVYFALRSHLNSDSCFFKRSEAPYRWWLDSTGFKGAQSTPPPASIPHSLTVQAWSGDFTHMPHLTWKQLA